MTVWEKNAARLRRQAAFRRFDKCAQELYQQSPVKFHLLAIAFAIIMCVIAIGLEDILEVFLK